MSISLFLKGAEKLSKYIVPYEFPPIMIEALEGKVDSSNLLEYLTQLEVFRVYIQSMSKDLDTFIKSSYKVVDKEINKRKDEGLKQWHQQYMGYLVGFYENVEMDMAVYKSHCKSVRLVFVETNIEASVEHIHVAMEILRRLHHAKLDETKIHTASWIQQLCDEVLSFLPEGCHAPVKEVLFQILIGHIKVPMEIPVVVKDIPNPEDRIARVVYMVRYVMGTRKNGVSEILDLIPGFTMMHVSGEHTYPDHLCTVIQEEDTSVHTKLRTQVLENSFHNIDIEGMGDAPLLYVFVLMHTYPEQCEALWKRYLAPYNIPYMEGMAEVFPLEELEELRFLSQRYWKNKENKYIFQIVKLLGLEFTTDSLDLCQHLTYTFQFSLEELME